MSSTSCGLMGAAQGEAGNLVYGAGALSLSRAVPRDSGASSAPASPLASAALRRCSAKLGCCFGIGDLPFDVLSQILEPARTSFCQVQHGLREVRVNVAYLPCQITELRTIFLDDRPGRLALALNVRGNALKDSVVSPAFALLGNSASVSGPSKMFRTTDAFLQPRTRAETPYHARRTGYLPSDLP